MIVCILGNRIASTYNFVELLNSFWVITQLIVAIPKQIIISIVPFTTFTTIFLQIRNSLRILFQIEIAFPNNLVEFRDFLTIAFWQLLFGHRNSFFKFSQLKIQVCLIV